MTARTRSRPRVLYVLKRFPRLSETFILNELLRLEDRGAMLGVDSLLPPEEGPQHPEFDRLQAPVRHLPSRSGAAALVADRAMAEGFEHLHAHFATAAASVAIEAGRVAGLPVTVTAHAKDIFQCDYASTLASRLDGAAALVTVSEYNRRYLAERVPAVPVSVIYNGIDGMPYAQRDRNGPVLCVARLVEKKGLDTLIEATAVLAKRGQRVPVEVVGSGPLRSPLEALTAELGVADLVTFRGSLTSNQVDRAYREASMFALPCRIDRNGDRDGLPTVLGEAMVRGLPVITTDLVGIPELVRHAETGWLVAPEDPADLADAIAVLRADPALCDELAFKGASHARILLDPGRAAEALLALFGGGEC